MSTSRSRFSGVPLFLVIGSDALRAGKVARELAHRYAPDYEVAEAASGADAMALAEQLSTEGRRIALVLSSLALTDTDGWEAMTAVRAHHPGALRVVYLQPGDRDEAQLVQRPLQMGLADHYVVVPMVSPDEIFHAAISELLAEWAGSYGEQLEIAQLIGELGSARMHQLRDLAGRNGVPLGSSMLEAKTVSVR